MKLNKTLLLVASLLLAVTNMQAQLHKQLFVKDAGTLKEQLTEAEAQSITDLTITGNINAKDFKTMRDEFNKLKSLDLSAVAIRMYTGKGGTHPNAFYVYPKDCVPAYAFKGKQSLAKVVLSPSIRNLEDCAFQDCSNLKVLQIKKAKAPNLLPHALEGTATAIFIPLGSKGEYRSKEKWAGFNFVEGEPIEVPAICTQPGSLNSEIQKTGYRPEEVCLLAVSGSLNEEDFKYIQERMINLVSIDMSQASAKEIPAFTFAQKKYLMWVKLPQQLITIGDRAFSGCLWLAGEVVLPPTVQSLEYGAFLGCDKLEKVTCKGTKPKHIGENVFGTNSKTVLQ